MEEQIKALVRGSRLSVSMPEINVGDNTTGIQFEFDSGWTGYAKAVNFFRLPDITVSCNLESDNLESDCVCKIPQEIWGEGDGTFYFGVIGTIFDENGELSKRKSTNVITAKISEGAFIPNAGITAADLNERFEDVASRATLAKEEAQQQALIAKGYAEESNETAEKIKNLLQDQSVLLEEKADKDHIHDAAGENTNGFMSASDKGKLDGIDEGATKVGQKTSDGGEIFNDYEKNKALSATSHAEGGNIADKDRKGNIAGTKAFDILDKLVVSDTACKLTLGGLTESDKEFIQNNTNTDTGLVFSVKLLRANYNYIGKVKSIYGDEVTVEQLDYSDSRYAKYYSNSDSAGNDMWSNFLKNPLSYNDDGTVIVGTVENSFILVDYPEYGNKDFGTASHAEGAENKALSCYTHVEGKDNTAYGGYSHAEGKDTIAFHNAHSEGRNTKATGYNSHAEGDNTTSAGLDSHSEGVTTKALGIASHAEGELNQANGNRSHAEGYMTSANGEASHSSGYETKANGRYSHAEGYQTQAGIDKDSEGSHAEGYKTKALNPFSHAEGCETTADAPYSHAEGHKTKTVGWYSHAEGYNATTYGEYAHAEGVNTIANGRASHVEGDRGQSHGNLNHVEGVNCRAYGTQNHVEGIETWAGSQDKPIDVAHVEGHGTKAIASWQHVQGRHNKPDATKLHIVGNGNNADSPSNAHTLDWSGNAWYAGTGEFSGIILRSSTQGSTKKFKITVDDSGELSVTEIQTT